MYPMIKDYYQRGLITKEKVDHYLSAQLITKEEYSEIVGVKPI